MDQKELDSVSAMAEFSAAGTDGSLGTMPVEYVADLAKRMSGSPKSVGFGELPPEIISDQMMYTYFAAQAHGALAQVRERNEQERMDFNRRRTDSMFLRAGVTPEQAGRMQYDAENGDPSAMLGVKEKFFYGC